MFCYFARSQYIFNWKSAWIQQPRLYHIDVKGQKCTTQRMLGETLNVARIIQVCSLLCSVQFVWHSFSLNLLLLLFHFMSFTRVFRLWNTLNGAWQKCIEMSIDSDRFNVLEQHKTERDSHALSLSLLLYVGCLVSRECSYWQCVRVSVCDTAVCTQSIFSCMLFMPFPFVLWFSNA